MKKLIIAGLLIVLTLPLVFSACASSPAAALGEQFTVYAGVSVSITGESLKIKFVEMTGDSRCAKGNECFQAGEVKCLMLISYFDSQSSLEWVQPGGENITAKDFNVFHIVFNVQPYPEAGKKIKPEDYNMVMTVAKFGK